MAMISSKGVYALAAMHRLSLVKDNRPLQIRQIAKEQEIPQSFLEQILGKLKKAGLVKSIRGSRGGYLLAKEPKEILAKDILEALGDDMKLIDTDINNCVVNLYFEDMQERFLELFKCSLDECSRYKEEYDKNLHYII